MSKKIILLLVVCCFFVGAWGRGVSWANVPGKMSFQGRLLDAKTKAPLSSASVLFRLFDAGTGGNEVWNSPANMVVADTSGFFSVILGEGVWSGNTPEFSSLKFNRQYWLQVEVDGSVLKPRQLITAAPYAMAFTRGDKRIAGDLEVTNNLRVRGVLRGGSPVTIIGGMVVLDGNVGIGTGTPSTSLEVVGDLKVSGPITLNGLTYVWPALQPINPGYVLANTGGTLSWGPPAVGGADDDWQKDPDRLKVATSSRGIAQFDAVLHGTAANTHINLGFGNSVTGTSGQNYENCTVSGGSENTAAVTGATVAGGKSNTASDYYAAVGGGYNNEASNNQATVSGGSHNSASGENATVSGGQNNEASGQWAAVGGGRDNEASGAGNAYTLVGGGRSNTASAVYATVGGGYSNTASGINGTVAGGESNRSTADSASVAGGEDNTASGQWATVSGGKENTASGGTDAYTTVGGGRQNTASSHYATVGGGRANSAAAHDAVVAGGNSNAASAGHASIGGGNSNIASGDYSTVSGGKENTASGNSATVSGGENNIVEGGWAWAGGKNMNVTGAKTFAWGYADSLVTINQEDAFIIYSADVGIQTKTPHSPLTVDGHITPDMDHAWYLGTSTYRWRKVYSADGVFNTSDRRLKDNIGELDYGLAEVLELKPIKFSWKNKTEDGRQIGLVAQDVQPVIPEVVEEGDDVGKTLSLRYSRLVPVLIKAIQQQQQQIEELKAQVQDMKAAAN